jgi:hypothetical protein
VSALPRPPEGGELRARCDADSGEWYVTETVHGPYGVDHWTLAEGFLTRQEAWEYIEAKEAACNG